MANPNRFSPAVRSLSASSSEPPRPEADRDFELLRANLAEYEILDAFDGGGQGRVFRAMQRSTGRSVALKLLHAAGDSSERQRRRFEREIDLSLRLRHPNVVPVLDSGMVDGRPFLVTELVEGYPIDEYLSAFEQTPAQIVRLFVSICRALAAAHRAGIIHRDITPANLLVDLQGVPRILDFGLAKDLWEPEPAHSLSMVVVGTMPYLSPEQLRQGAANVDTRSDIFSVGSVLYQMLTGTLPFGDGSSPYETQKAIVDGEPASIRPMLMDAGVAAGWATDCEFILRKAMRKSPDDRYPTADAIADDLEHLLAGEAVSARAGSRLYLIRKFIRRYSLAVSLAALLVAVLLASTVTVTILWQNSERVLQRARTALTTAGYLRGAPGLSAADRAEQAVGLFHEAVELGQRIEGMDQFALEALFQAHFQLSQLQRTQNQLDIADSHAAIVRQMADQLGRDFGNNPRMQRLVARASLLEGQNAFTRGDYAAALDPLLRAQQIYESIQTDPIMQDSLLEELARAVNTRARALARLRDWAAADLCYEELYAIRAQIIQMRPGDFQSEMELARFDQELAGYYLNRRQLDDMSRVYARLRSMDQRMCDLVHHPQFERFRAEFDVLADAAWRTHDVVRRRVAGPTEPGDR